MHTCPDCGQACYCSGDIEDHDIGRFEVECMHCLHAAEDEDEYDALAAKGE